MAEPFLAETRIMSFNFAPQGWALCNGQFLPINQNQALFSLLGTAFGGNGQTTFALPDLRARTPIHAGNGHTIGERGGEQAHTLTITELPTHTHSLSNINQAVSTNIPVAGTSVLGNTAPNQVYNASGQNLVAMNPAAISSIGGNQAHLNMQPFLVLNFCIALQGIFPSQN
jgi:microcystin-dependent protein